jgi:hypothetical protein
MIFGKYIGSMIAISIALVSTKGDQSRTMTPCTPSIEPAITVTVSDAQTKAPLEATVIVKDGQFQEELNLNGVTAAGNIIYGGAFERPGVYTITISKDAYETSILREVKVERGECHVMTRNISVTLERVNAN